GQEPDEFRFAFYAPIHDHPDEARDAPGNGCVEERYHRNTVDRVGVPGIEAEPAKPEDGHPNPCQMEILRFIAHVPASKVQHTREGAHSRDRVDHDPAPEVEHAPLL